MPATTATATTTTATAETTMKSAKDESPEPQSQKQPRTPSARFLSAETTALTSLLAEMYDESCDQIASSSSLPPKAQSVSSEISLTDSEEKSRDSFTSLSDRRTVQDLVMFDHYGERGIYSGAVQYEEPHGFGVMKYAEDNRVYEGEWVRGRYQGLGKTIFPNGDVYQGQYHVDMQHGKGKYVWKDGRVYVGDFCEDARQGYGIYAWPDGSRYEGQFSDGRQHGKGNKRFPCGAIYRGLWKNGKMHGQGKLVYADGSRFEGTFVDDRKDGEGKEYNSDASLRHEGQWQKDERVAQTA